MRSVLRFITQYCHLQHLNRIKASCPPKYDQELSVFKSMSNKGQGSRVLRLVSDWNSWVLGIQSPGAGQVLLIQISAISPSRIPLLSNFNQPLCVIIGPKFGLSDLEISITQVGPDRVFLKLLDHIPHPCPTPVIIGVLFPARI